MSNGYDDLSSERMLLSRVWATPAEIYRAINTLGQTGLRALVEGRRFLLRSDFPVALYVNNNLVGAAGLPAFPPFYRFSLGKGEKGTVRQLQVEFRFPRGWGATSTGGTVDAEILGKHGTCCLDAAWSDEAEPMPPNVDLLPCTTFAQVSSTIVAAVEGLKTTLIYNVADFRLPFNQNLINELYVKAFGAGMEDANQGPAVDGAHIYEWTFEKTDNPAGDAEVLMTVEQGLHAFMVGTGAIKLPIRSLFSAYAAEAPQCASSVYGSATYDSTIITVRFVGGYL